MSTADEIQEERRRQRDFQREQQTIQQAFSRGGELDRTTIEQILSSDDIIEGSADDLQDVTITKIQSTLSKNTMLANLTSAQEHDKRYWLDVQKYKVLGSHPPDDSCIKGPVRAFLWDDPMEELEPLTPQERLIIEDFFSVLKDMVTRGRDGFERKQINTSIARSEQASNNDGKKKGGLKGLFSS